MSKKISTPESLEKRRQQYRDAKRKQRANQEKGLEFSITLGKRELHLIKWINAHSDLTTKSSVINELLKEAFRRGLRYKASTKVTAKDVELILGDPDHINVMNHPI